MGPEALALAGTFSSTVVAAMATDAWQETRTRVIEIWRRFQPDRADTTRELLEENRTELLGISDESRSDLEQLLIDHWRLRLFTLMQTDPAVGELLAGMLAGQQSSDARVNQAAHSHDNSRIFMAGRDQVFHNHE